MRRATQEQVRQAAESETSKIQTRMNELDAHAKALQADKIHSGPIKVFGYVSASIWLLVLVPSSIAWLKTAEWPSVSLTDLGFRMPRTGWAVPDKLLAILMEDLGIALLAFCATAFALVRVERIDEINREVDSKIAAAQGDKSRHSERLVVLKERPSAALSDPYPLD